MAAMTWGAQMFCPRQACRTRAASPMLSAGLRGAQPGDRHPFRPPRRPPGVTALVLARAARPRALLRS